MANMVRILTGSELSVNPRPAKRVKNVHATETILAIQRMKQAAYEWEERTGLRCEGLAAPQIGVNLRIVLLRRTDEMKSFAPKGADYVVHGDVKQGFDELRWLKDWKNHREWNRVRGGVYDPWTVMINPKILQVEGFQNSIEGCLSLPGRAYQVVRPTHVSFRFTRPNRTYSGVHLAKGDNAVKLMHEIDHLKPQLLNDIAEAETCSDEDLSRRELL